jgi:tetratricopeptide (TPR) repeat protein
MKIHVVTAFRVLWSDLLRSVSMSSIRVWVCLAALAFGTAVPVPSLCAAQVEEESTDDQARRHFRLGSAHYENGSFLEAAHEFEEAYRLSNRAQLLYNIYVAYRDAGDLPHSRDALRSYLEQVPDAENAAMLRARLESLDRMLAAAPPPTTESTPPSTEPESEPQATSVDTETSDGEASAATSSGHSLSPFPFAIAGLGAALMVSGAITGPMALSSEQTLNSMCPNRACPPGYDFASEADRGRTLALATDILLISGGVVLAAGVVWFVLDLVGASPSSEPTAVAAACTTDGCQAALRFDF